MGYKQRERIPIQKLFFDLKNARKFREVKKTFYDAYNKIVAFEMRNGEHKTFLNGIFLLFWKKQIFN